MTLLTFEEHIARKIIAHYDKDWDKAIDSLEDIEREICSLSENCNVDIENYNEKSGLENEKKVKYLPIWCDTGGYVKLHSVIISKEDEEDIKQAIGEAKHEIFNEDMNYNLDMIVDRISEKIDIVESEDIGGIVI